MSDQGRPVSAEGRWPDPHTGPFRLRLWFGHVAGRSAVVGVELWGTTPQHRPWMEYEPQLPDAPIRAADARLPLGAFLDQHVDMQQALAKAALKPEFLDKVAATWPSPADLGPVIGPIVEAQRKAALAEASDAAKSVLGAPHPRRRGRKPLADADLKLAAQLYQDAWARGDRAPAKAVAHELQRRGHNISDWTVRRRLVIARDRGLLTVGGTKRREPREGRP